MKNFPSANPILLPFKLNSSQSNSIQFYMSAGMSAKKVIGVPNGIYLQTTTIQTQICSLDSIS